MKLLSRVAIRIFAPSKRQNNAPLVVGSTRIESSVVAEVPADARLLDMDSPATQPVENVRIELRAQDLEAVFRIRERACLQPGICTRSGAGIG